MAVTGNTPFNGNAAITKTPRKSQLTLWNYKSSPTFILGSYKDPQGSAQPFTAFKILLTIV